MTYVNVSLLSQFVVTEKRPCSPVAAGEQGPQDFWLISIRFETISYHEL